MSTHRCQAETMCTAKVRNRVYRWGERVSLFEGALVRLIEEETDTSSEGCLLSAPRTVEGSTGGSPDFNPEEEADHVLFTQLEMTLFPYARDAHTGRPFAPALRDQGIQDEGVHWEAFAEDVYAKTYWHREADLRAETRALRPLVSSSARVLLFAFDQVESIPFQVDLHWEDAGSDQPGLHAAKAEMRLILWERIPPLSPYCVGTAFPQPTTRQQNGKDHIYVVGQPEEDGDNLIAILLVTNYVSNARDQYHIRAFRTALISGRQQILTDMAIVGLCRTVTCIVSREQEIWQDGVVHMLVIGMRIDVEIHLDEDPVNECAYSQQETAVRSVPNNMTLYSEEDGEEESAGSLAYEDVILMQTAVVSAPDNGWSMHSHARLAQCVAGRLPWVEPVRLEPHEMFFRWSVRGIDLVREHFAQQAFFAEGIDLMGWLFRDHLQETGTPFAWGLTANSPWVVQISRLMHDAGFMAAVMYDITPSLPCLEEEGEVKNSWHLIAPFEGYRASALLLVIEHKLQNTPFRGAFRCFEPCQARRLFALVGLSHRCDEQNQCSVIFLHGICRKDFLEDDIIELPTASLVTLQIIPTLRRDCVARSRIGQATEIATQVADSLHTRGSQSHQEVLRKARRVLLHTSATTGRAGTAVEDDQTNLMQADTFTNHRSQPLRDDVEIIRTRAFTLTDVCLDRGADFHFVLELAEGTRHWVETCSFTDLRSSARFFDWFFEQMPESAHRPLLTARSRALLASRRIMAAWTVLLPRMPLYRPVPVLVNLLSAGTRFPVLHLVQVEGVESPRRLHHMATGDTESSRSIEIVAQIHDSTLEADWYTNMFPGLVVDIQELSTWPIRSNANVEGVGLAHSDTSDSVSTSSDDVVSMMQRQVRPESETGSSSMPTTLTSQSMRVSSLSSGPPPIRESESHFVPHVVALQRAQEFLLSYWREQPRNSAAVNLLVQCVVFWQQGTTCANILWPAHLIEDPLAIDHFSDFCDRVCPPIEYSHSRIFPAQTEVHLNTPTVVLVDDCRGCDVPVIVLVHRDPEHEAPVVFTYLATQVVPAWHVIAWVELHMALPCEVELELNQDSILPGDLVTFQPGDVLVLRAHLGTTDQSCSSHQYPVDSDDGPHPKKVQIQDDEDPSTLGREIGGNMLLQLSVVKINWRRPPLEGLRPPGNPTKLSLVETLRQVATPQGRRTISLDKHLDPPDSQRTAPFQSVSAQLDPSIWECLEWDPCEDLQTNWQVLTDLPEDTCAWCEQASWMNLWDWDPTQSQHLEVYTDGSFRGQQAAWAFVVACSDGEERDILGYLSAAVESRPEKERFLYPVQDTAYVGEAQALKRSTWWLLRFVRAVSWRGQVTFRWDSVVAGNKAKGLYVAHDPNGAIVRSLQLALEAYLGPADSVLHEHVKAHTGVHLNEIADSAAKYSLRCASHYTERGSLRQLVTSPDPILPWLWRLLHDWQDPQLPSWDGNAMRVHNSIPLADHTVETVRGHMLWENECQGQHCLMSFSIRIASYNALSLGNEDHETISSTAGRVAWMREVVNAKGIHLFGIQEARTPIGIIQSASHLRICSGADNGCLGVELWVSLEKAFAYADGKPPLRFRARDISVCHADPRILIVDVCTEAVSFWVCVAHAPHTGTAADIRIKWWSSFREFLRAKPEGKELVLLIDANARCDHHVWPWVGELLEDKPNANTEEWYKLLASQELFVPSSFVSSQWGNFSTWTHPATGAQSRIDYACLPISWMHGQIDAWTDPDIHSGHAGADHCCTIVNACWTAAAIRKSSHHTRLDVDRMLTPEGNNTIRNIVRGLPQMPWETNATEHAAVLTEAIQNRLAEEFPMPRRIKTWACPSEATRECLEKLTSVRRELRGYKNIYKHCFLRFFFDAWMKASWTDHQVTWVGRVALEKARLGKELRQAAKQFASQLKQDKKEYLTRVATDAARLSVSEIYRALRPLMPSRKTNGAVKPMPQIRKLDNTLTVSLKELDDRWTEHFSLIEAGQIQDTASLIRECVRRQGTQQWPELECFWTLPTLQNLEAAFQKLRPRRAPGPDRIPAELLKAAPAEMARLCYPLLLKLAIRSEEPVQWKGGRTIALYKGKGAHDICANFRSILLMSTIGKALRAAMRPLINAPYVHTSPQGQLGGKPRQSVLCGAQIVRHFIAWHKQKSQSCVVLFCDVMSAFYTVLRELAVGVDDSRWERNLHRITEHFGLGPETHHNLTQALRGHSEFQQLGANSLQNGLLRESLTDTWFSFDGKRTVRTAKGSRPGDSWADCTFNILFQAVLQKLLQKLKRLGLIAVLSDGEQVSEDWPMTGAQADEPFQVTWADDLAVLLSFDTPQEILTKLPFAASALFDTLAEYGMKAAIGPSKTAAIVLARGKDAVKVRRHLFKDKDAGCFVILEDETVKLPFVDRYKHLGGLVSATANLQLEIRARCAKSRSAFWRIGHKVLRNRRLPFASRKSIFEATVVSVHAWGAGAWPLLSAQEWRTWATALRDLYLKMVPQLVRDQHLHVSRCELLLEGSFSRPEDVLHVARVRHIGSMILSAPPLLHAFVVRDIAAMQGYRSSMQWFWNGLGRDQGLPRIQDWSGWKDFILASPVKWKSTIKRVALRYTRGFQRLAEAELWHRRIFRCLQELNCVEQVGAASSTVHVCLPCQKGFSSMRAWFCHASQKHGYISMQGEAAKGQICPCCSKQYRSALSLKHHLSYSSSCRTFMWERRDEMQHEAAGEQHPQMPWRNTEQIPVPPTTNFDRDTVRLTSELDYILHYDFGDTEQDHFSKRLAAKLQDACTTVMPFASIHKGFTTCASKMVDSRDAHLLDALQEVGTWLLQQSHQFTTRDNHTDFIPDESDRASISVCLASLPPPSGRPSVALFLHFFSGHIRVGDLQWWLEKVHTDLDSTIEVASIDIVISAEKCDLASRNQQAKLLTWIRSGHIAGILIGPPCETWSVAREELIGTSGPRPVRSRTAPWGLWDLKLNEHCQVAIGSLLLGFAFEAMLAQASKGGFGAMEHPRDPTEFMQHRNEAPSIWNLQVTRWLLSTGLFHLLRVEQGHHGASSRKPTTLMICGVPPESASYLEKQVRSQVAPQNSNIGRNADGTGWRTSHLKVYPSGFCRFLALLYREWWYTRASLPQFEVEEARQWLKDLVQALPMGETTFGPDFNTRSHR